MERRWRQSIPGLKARHRAEFELETDYKKQVDALKAQVDHLDSESESLWEDLQEARQASDRRFVEGFDEAVRQHEEAQPEVERAYRELFEAEWRQKQPEYISKTLRELDALGCLSLPPRKFSPSLQSCCID